MNFLSLAFTRQKLTLYAINIISTSISTQSIHQLVTQPRCLKAAVVYSEWAVPQLLSSADAKQPRTHLNSHVTLLEALKSLKGGLLHPLCKSIKSVSQQPHHQAFQQYIASAAGEGDLQDTPTHPLDHATGTSSL
jgi:hypothetical protein